MLFFFNIQSWPKIAKSFYFLQTISKRPNLDDLAFKKSKWQPCSITHFQKVKYATVLYSTVQFDPEIYVN